MPKKKPKKKKSRKKKSASRKKVNHRKEPIQHREVSRPRGASDSLSAQIHQGVGLETASR